MHAPLRQAHAAAIAASLGLCSHALAQCGWLPAVPAPEGTIQAFRTWDPDGGGPEPELLYAGGWFQQVAGQDSRRVAAWDGTSWRYFDTPMSDGVRALAVYQGSLIAAGDFTTASGNTVNRVARWDGAEWQPLGLGVNDDVNTLLVHDGVLIAGGNFTAAGGQPALHIAAWNGGSWSAMSSPGRQGNSVNALTVWNGTLVMGGSMSDASGPIASVWRWDAGGWQAMGPTDGGTIEDFIVTPQGQLIAAGEALNDFTIADPDTILAHWNGAHWERAPYEGVAGSAHEVAMFDGLLVAAGQFWWMPGGEPIGNIATWDPSGWTSLQTGVDGTIYAMEVYRDQLVVGGSFFEAGGQPNAYFARWGCQQACYANCDGSTVAPALNVTDFTCFLQRYAAGQSYANCDQSTVVPVLNVSDFTCFLQAYAAGCP